MTYLHFSASLTVAVGLMLQGCGGLRPKQVDLPPVEISLELTKADGTAYWAEFCFSAAELTYDRVKFFRVTPELGSDALTVHIPEEPFRAATLGIGKSKECDD